MRHRTRHHVTTLVLLVLIFSGPVGLAAYLLKQSSSIPEFRLSTPAPSAATFGVTSTARNPLVTGVLYAAGKARVNWSGTEIPIENSRYVYLGGETVDVPHGSLGILSLARGDTVFICPGSKVRLSRAPKGGYTLDVMAGASRFMFGKDTPFTVRVNDTVLAPDLGAGESADEADQTFVGEVQAHREGGCLLCEFSRNLRVTVPGGTAAAAGGRIVNVTTRAHPLAGGVPATPAPRGKLHVASLPIPKDVMSTLPVGYPGNAVQAAAAYLCRCDRLRRIAEEPPLVAAGRVESPKLPGQPLPPLVSPPLAPPEIAPIALATPGAPQPDFGFDPNLLPPTAAGPTQSPIVVPPPLVPTAGTGGGGGVTPVAVVVSPS